MLFIALLPLPYGYYTILRYVICIASVVFVIREYDREITVWIALFAVAAILFNPLLPVHFYRRSPWFLINILTGLLFLIKALSKK
jgi:hypothetical protein